jgi:mitochondrial fission 1 protein
MQVLRSQYRREVAQSHVSVQTKFNYAWGLVKCPRRDEQTEGVKLLQGQKTFSHGLMPSLMHLLELYREEPTRRRECLYYLALGYYKMGNFDDARKFNGTEFSL